MGKEIAHLAWVATDLSSRRAPVNDPKRNAKPAALRAAE